MGMELTQSIVAELTPPTDKRWSVTWDDAVPGFGVRITSTGYRSYVLLYRVRGDGTQHLYTIGQAKVNGKGDWELGAARTRARALRREIDAGGDPVGDLKKKREAKAEYRSAPAVNDLADRYIKEHAKLRKRPRSVYEDESLLNQWIRPELGVMKVRDVATKHVEDLHAKITRGERSTKKKGRKGTPARANGAVALLSKMFSLAVKWEMRPDNPCRGVERNPVEKRERYLETKDELPRFLAALSKHADREGINAIRLLLFTGARRNEVLFAEWSQFDLNTGIWVKPSAHTKQKKIHRAPLSPQAVQLLKQMRADADAGDDRAAALERKAEKEKDPKRKLALMNQARLARAQTSSPYLFPSTRADGKALANLRKLWLDICRDAKVENFRLHDLRHSFASILASAGVSLQIIGGLIGHTQPATTARYAHLLDSALRTATARAGKLIAAAEAGKKAEVVKFPRKRR